MNIRHLVILAAFLVASLSWAEGTLLQEGVDVASCQALLVEAKAAKRHAETDGRDASGRSNSKATASGDSGHWAKLTEEQEDFIVRLMMPVVGKRAIALGYYEPSPNPKGKPARLHLRNVVLTRTSITWPGYQPRRTGPAGKYLRVQWSDEATEPHLLRGVMKYRKQSDWEVPHHVLVMPRNNHFTMKPQAFRDLMLEWLVGHTLYPYIIEVDKRPAEERVKLGEPPVFQRPVQTEAIQVAHHYVSRFFRPLAGHSDRAEYRKLMVAAPTSTGKTRILVSALAESIRQNPNPKGLYLAVGDRDSYVSDMEDDIEDMATELAAAGKPIKVVRWGGGKTDSAEAINVEQLAQLVNESDVPVVLVTLIQSFKSRAGLRADKTKKLDKHPELIEEKFGLLAPLVHGQFYDEVHNAGAFEARALLNFFATKNPNLFFFGITPIPDQKIQQIYEGHVFWGYLDNAINFLARTKKIFSSQRIFQQLKIAHQRHEILPITKVVYLALKEEFGPEVFEQKRANAVPVLREDYYPALFARIADAVRRRKGFICANSVPEARALVNAFNLYFDTEAFGHRRAELFVSDDAPAGSTKEKAILDRYFANFDDHDDERETHVLVTVKKLDAGTNLFPASFYVELTQNPDPRLFVNRQGRAARSFEENEDIWVYLVTPESEKSLGTRIRHAMPLFGDNTRPLKPVRIPLPLLPEPLAAGAPPGPAKGEDLPEDEGVFVVDDEPAPVRGAVAIDPDDFFTLAANSRGRTVHFWDRNDVAYMRLSDEERSAFVASIYPLLVQKFTGFASDFLSFIATLREKIGDPALVADFDRKVRVLNVSSSTAVGAKAREAGNVDKIHAVLQFYAEARPGLQLDSRLLILEPDNLQDLFPEIPFGLKTENHDELRHAVYPAMARCFTSLNSSMLTLFTETLLPEIPEAERQKYLLAIAGTDLNNNTGSRVHFQGEDIATFEAVLRLYSSYQTAIPFDSTQKLDAAWVKRLFAKWYVYPLKPVEIAKLKTRGAGSYVDFLSSKIPGLIRRAKSGFTALGRHFITDPDRLKAYEERLRLIGIKEGTIETSLKSGPSAEPLHNWNAAMWAFAQATMPQPSPSDVSEKLIPMALLQNVFARIGFAELTANERATFKQAIFPLIYEKIRKNAISSGVKEWNLELRRQSARFAGEPLAEFLRRIGHLETFSPRGIAPEDLAQGALVAFVECFSPLSVPEVRRMDVDAVRAILDQFVP